MLEIVIIIIAAAVLIIAAVLILVMLLKDRNKNNMTGSGGVDLNHDLLELQRKLNAQSGLHSGTLVVQTNRVKISVYNCRNNTETVAYVINELVFGRRPSDQINDPSAYFITDDPMVSGRHFRIINRSNVLYAEDLNSSNHTYLNGYRLDQRTPLTGNDEIEAGQTKFIVRTYN